jgi:hypothetical protein
MNNAGWDQRCRQTAIKGVMALSGPISWVTGE